MGYDGSWEPRLIKSFDIDPTGLVYTMHLQDGVKWHTNHGEWGEFDADDLIFSLEQLSREGGAHVQAGNAKRLFGCDECVLTKIDDLTVSLTRPTPTFQLTWFSQAPIPGFSMNSKKHFEGVGEEAALLQDVGTGAWEAVEMKTDQHRKMKAVTDHWRHTPEFAEMIWHDIPEQSTRLANFLTGDLDTGIFNADSRQAIKDAGNPDVKFMKFPAAIVQMIWHEGGNYTPDSKHHVGGADANVPVDAVNSDYKQICHLRAWIACDREIGSAGWEKARKVREAMTLSIDRQKLINNIAFGEGEPWFVGIWANRARMEQFGLDKLKWDFDPARAKELLVEAGYPDGFDVPIALRGGTGDLIINLEAVAVMWEEIGLKTTLRNVQPASYRVESAGRNTMDIYGLNDAPSFPEPLRVYGTVYTSAGNSYFGINHPIMDQLIEDTEAEMDEEKRWGIQADIARFIFDNTLSMPLYAENAVWPLGPEVDSWKAAPAELDWLSYWEMPRRRQ